MVIRRDAGGRSARETLALLARLQAVPAAGAPLLEEDRGGHMGGDMNGDRTGRLPVCWHRPVRQQFMAGLAALRRTRCDGARLAQQWEAALALLARWPGLYRPGRQAGSREIDHGVAGCLCYRIAAGRIEILALRAPCTED
jgi:hypothetical protein